MGQLEKESRKRSRNKELQRIILATVATAGILGVALLAPNAMRMIEVLGFDKKKRQREIIHASRDRLIKAGLLDRDTKGFLTLTDKGKHYLYIWEKRPVRLHSGKPKSWDKKWRILIFDIKESRRGVRDMLRRTLQAVGFERIQNSVWVYPHDCEDFVVLLKSDFNLGKDLLYIITDTIENDALLRRKFNVS